jgi:hypothetical protein
MAERVRSFIIATRHREEVTEGDAQLLVDVDLPIPGSEAEVFWRMPGDSHLPPSDKPRERGKSDCHLYNIQVAITATCPFFFIARFDPSCQTAARLLWQRTGKAQEW